MIADLTRLGPWTDDETIRILPCPQHPHLLYVENFERTLHIAETCHQCRVQHRPTEGATT